MPALKVPWSREAAMALGYHRRGAELSIEALARRLGVSPKTVWRWESAVNGPSEASLRRLARALKVKPEALRG